MKTVFVGVNSKYIHTALGLRYIAEYCRGQGIPASLLEFSVNEPILSVLARISALVEPQEDRFSGPSFPAAGSAEAEELVFGLEVHIWNRQYVLELCELLRKLYPRCRILLGGPEVLFHPKETLETVPWADHVVCGEGEEVVAEFLSKLQEAEAEQDSGKDGTRRRGKEEKERPVRQMRRVTPLAGIAYRTEDGGITVPRGLVIVEDLDKLPFPYPDLADVAARHKIIYYEASRGCPFHCAYCLSGITRSVRRRSLPLVLADIERLTAAGVRLIKFVDRTYNLDESYYLPMMEYLAERDTEATFHFEIKGDILSSRAVSFLQTVPKGRFQLEIGVQSTNNEVLCAIGRKDNWKCLEANVKELLAAGNMHIHMDLIAGLPLEDMQSLARSFNDVYALRPQTLQLGFLKILPGTVMDLNKKKYGIIHMDQPPYEVLATAHLSSRELQFLKVLEEVFDLTGNSGRFTYTLEYLVRQEEKRGSGAFSFFAGLARWYREKELFGQGHTGAATAGFLFRYVQERKPELLFAVKELLRLDTLIHLPGFRPEWLEWRTGINYAKTTAFWRNEELVRAYLPGYTFKNWRTLHKRYTLEEFLFDPWTEEKNSLFILVDHEEMCLTRIAPSDII